MDQATEKRIAVHIDVQAVEGPPADYGHRRSAQQMVEEHVQAFDRYAGIRSAPLVRPGQFHPSPTEVARELRQIKEVVNLIGAHHPAEFQKVAQLRQIVVCYHKTGLNAKRAFLRRAGANQAPDVLQQAVPVDVAGGDPAIGQFRYCIDREVDITAMVQEE